MRDAKKADFYGEVCQSLRLSIWIKLLVILSLRARQLIDGEPLIRENSVGREADAAVPYQLPNYQ